MKNSTTIKKHVTYSLLITFLLFGCGKQKMQDYPIKPVPFTSVRLTDNFWLPRLEVNRTVTIPHTLEKCEETGRIDNFAIAGGLMDGEQSGTYPFDDTDIYKIIEGASYSLMVHYDPKLDSYLDSLIVLIAAAQEDDGYLYTARTNNSKRLKRWYGDQRWEKISGSHELYNAGHLYEAAVAHNMVTGKRNLLDIALKNADLITEVFGPEKLQAPPGHQVIEMGLVKLYRTTGEKKYLNLAKFFLDIRGKALDGRELGGKYNQDHLPIVDQEEAVGHAVRASYMYAGIADLAAITGDDSYIKTVNRLWDNVTGKKLYLTGGIGASGSGEAFGKNYELPNMSAYNETCASIGNVYWNFRLFLLSGESKYVDVLERTLYNALLSGISLDGKSFFYPNPLESVGQHERSGWFSCACCPGNVTRFIVSVPGYIYAVKKDDIYINLFAGNDAEIKTEDQTVKVSQTTGYPWDGTINISIDPEIDNSSFSLYIRLPGWARNQPVAGDLYRYLSQLENEIKMTVNEKPLELNIQNGYVSIKRSWKKGDRIVLEMPMPVRRVLAHQNVEADRGKVALERGPIVYCAEWPDNQNGHIRNLLIDDNVTFSTEFRKNLLNGVQTISGTAKGFKYNANRESTSNWDQKFTAIPYYAWAHRGKGEMSVWLAREESAVSPLSGPTLASKSTVTVSYGKNPQAINDQLEPKNSIDHSVPFFHWWPHKETTEWVEFKFPGPAEVSMVEVYWFDDTGIGECRLPKSWNILYRDDKNNKWQPVYTTDQYGTAKDKYNKVTFETVQTGALRIEILSQPDYAGGIHELRVK